MPSADRDRGRIDDVALNPARDEQTVDPEAVEPGFLNDNHPDRRVEAPRRRCPQPPQKGEQRAAVAAVDCVLG